MNRLQHLRHLQHLRALPETRIESYRKCIPYLEDTSLPSSLDYQDLGFSDNMLESFLIYQSMLAKQFRNMQKKYGRN